MVDRMMERATDRIVLAEPLPFSRGGSVRSPWPYTVVAVSDTHVGSENNDLGDPNERQVAAVNTISQVPFPLGGVCGIPAWKVVLGDFKHHDNETVDRAADIFNGFHTMDGNHDNNDVRDYIVSQHGSLTWGQKIGHVYFQAMTENFISEPNGSFPPHPDQIAAVKAALLARAPDEPKVLMVHRALSGGYVREWLRPDQEYPAASELYGSNSPGGVDTDSLTPFNDLLNSVPNLKLLLHGHDHYPQNYAWAGGGFGTCNIRVISPGSVRQAPEECPYSTLYPEAFLVLRIWPTRIEYGCYQFGFSATPDTPCPPGRVYAPGVWLFSGSVTI